MRVVVTGSTGYLGCIVVPVLEAAGHDVTGWDSDLFSGCDFPPDAAVAPPDRRVDIRDAGVEDLRGYDAVVHLAALSNDPLGDLDAALTADINHRASVRLAEAAREAGVGRFVFMSSCSNYGGAGGDRLLDEDEPLQPLTPYGASKVAVERDLLPRSTGDFAAVALRCATAFGVSPRLRLDIAINDLVAFGVALGEVVLRSDGMAWRPFLHVQDIARAVAATLAAPAGAVAGRAFNVGSTAQNYRIREVAERIGARLGLPVQRPEAADHDARNYRVDCTGFAEATGFAAEWDLDRGVDELAEAFQRAAMDAEMHGGARYRRLRTIRRLLDDGRVDASLRWTAAAP